jgi:hypothetical protein
MYVSRKGKRRGAYRFLIGKPEGKTPLGRARRRWEDYIKMDQYKGLGCEVARDRGLTRINWYHKISDNIDEVTHKPMSF